MSATYADLHRRSRSPLLLHTGRPARPCGGGLMTAPRYAAKVKSGPLRTANSAERTLTAVMAVPHPGLWEKLAASIGSNGSTLSGDFSEIEATIHRPCDARSDDDGNRAALLSDLREYLPERWPCLIGYLNVEVAKYEAKSKPKIRDEGLRSASKMMDDNLSVFGKIVEIVRPLLHHAQTLWQVLRVIVGGANLVAFVMGKLAFDPIGRKPQFV